MKILLTHRFFWPDTAPYAVMLRAIGDALAEAGHEVHCFSSVPSYRQTTAKSLPRETLGALNLHRVWVFPNEKANSLKRFVNVLIYCVRLFVEVLRLRPDVVTASTFPPVVAAWSASLAARMIGAHFVYHLQDIHPEVSQISGGRMGRGLTMRALRWLDNQTLRRSAVIVTLSQDMAETLRARNVGELPIQVINNFSIDLFGEVESPPTDLRKPEGRRRATFAGNLGRFQNLPQLADGVALLFDEYPDLELFFLGDGTVLQDLKARWGSHPQVKFGPFIPFAQAKSLISESDVGLVSLESDLFRVAYPSKIASYLAQGVPVLALVEAESEIAAQIAREKLGATAPVDSPEAVAAALRELLEVENDPRPHIVDWVSREAVALALLPRWVTLFNSIADHQDFRHRE